MVCLRKKEGGEERCVCVCVCALHFSEPVCICVCSFVDKDLETDLSESLHYHCNDLDMVPANAGYSNIPAYSNVRADYFS